MAKILFPRVEHQIGMDKPLLYFPFWLFDRIKGYGNTHYCGLCLGLSGFRYSKGGRAWNFHDEHTKCKLLWQSEGMQPKNIFMRGFEALTDPTLARHLYDEPDHPRPKEAGGAAYTSWKHECAFFRCSPALARVAKRRGLKIWRCRNHTESHVDHVIGSFAEASGVENWMRLAQPNSRYRIVVQF